MLNMMDETFRYVGTQFKGTQVCYYIPGGGLLLLQHPRHIGHPNLNMFEWGTVNNRSYFLAQAILEHHLSPAAQVAVSDHMIECFQREVIAKADATEHMHIEESDVKKWINDFLRRVEA